MTIAPPANRNRNRNRYRYRYLMYARPEQGGIVLSAGPAAFAEFFPPLTEHEASAAIGSPEPEGAPHLSGSDLEARLDQIETFLRSLSRPGNDVA